MTEPTSFDVIIVGGGAMGISTAAAVAATGRSVLLLERHPVGHDLGGSHGATRLFRVVYDEPDYVSLAQRALAAWRELESITGRSLLITTGGVEHGLPPDGLKARTGVLSAAGLRFDVIDADEAMRRWPGMRFETSVLVQPDAARIKAAVALDVLGELAEARGAELHYAEPVTEISAEGEAVIVRTVQENYRAAKVIITAGPWTPALATGWATLPPLRVTQEQPRHFRPKVEAADWPSFVHRRTGAGSYGLFAPGEGVKVGLHGTGPVIEPDVRSGPAPDQDQELLDYVRDWFPGLDADDSEPISCLYDNSPNDDFIIDSFGPVTVATGFSGHGFKFTPVIGQLLADLAFGGTALAFGGTLPDRFRVRAR